jgi:hypothetical protein
MEQQPINGFFEIVLAALHFAASFTVFYLLHRPASRRRRGALIISMALQYPVCRTVYFAAGRNSVVWAVSDAVVFLLLALLCGKRGFLREAQKMRPNGYQFSCRLPVVRKQPDFRFQISDFREQPKSSSLAAGERQRRPLYLPRKYENRPGGRRKYKNRPGGRRVELFWGLPDNKGAWKSAFVNKER